MAAEDRTNLKEMKIRIDKIEQLALELKEMGREVPAVRKNCRLVLSATYNLMFGISDVAEIMDAEGGM